MTECFTCRENCGACCIAPSISSAILGIPNGKLANQPCIQLDSNLRCKIFGDSKRPLVCAGLQPSQEMCSDDRKSALHYLQNLEKNTQP